MTLEEKVTAVNALFSKLDAEISTFQKASGLDCPWGCGACCFKADIEATALEFLPFAVHLYKKQEAETWYDRLKENTSPICVILNPTAEARGLCSQYPYRGLICRLFGYSARLNKHGKRELVTCQIIKGQPEFAAVQKRVVEDLVQLPVMSQYYMHLHGIDPELSRTFYPINLALRRAIEEVLHYYAYRSDEYKNEKV